MPKASSSKLKHHESSVYSTSHAAAPANARSAPYAVPPAARQNAAQSNSVTSSSSFSPSRSDYRTSSFEYAEVLAENLDMAVKRVQSVIKARDLLGRPSRLHDHVEHCLDLMVICRNQLGGQLAIMQDLSRQLGLPVTEPLPPFVPPPLMIDYSHLEQQPPEAPHASSSSHAAVVEEAKEDQTHPKAGDRLSRADGLLSALSKSFLKDVQQQLGVYGGGTNRDMADGIFEHLEEVMNSGGSLRNELSVIKSVHEECYPSCAYDDGEASSESD